MKNNYDKILDIFTYKETVNLKDWGRLPFVIDETAYASDFNSMVFFNKENCSEYETLKVNVLGVIPKEINQSFKIKVSELKEAFVKIPLIEGYETKGEDVECNDCNGHGVVDWEYKNHTKEFDCPVCDGDGKSFIAPRIKNGIFEHERGYFVHILNTRFASKYLKKLINVCEILGETEIELINQTEKSKANLFKIKDVQIVLMPVMFDESDNFNVVIKLQ